MTYHQELPIQTTGRKTYEITQKIRAVLQASSVKNGLCNVFIAHTSCSVFINENADPSVQYDLNNYLNRLVPENDPHYTHIFEGDDDMPAHIKAALLPSSITIPIQDGRLLLGTWQGIFLWEHRTIPHRRKVHVTIMG
jgi:secondary thiamine-phosphate synthase enzyme